MSADFSFTTAGRLPGPTISAISVSAITNSSASVTWTLSEAATGQVEFGATTSYGRTSTRESSFSYTTHTQQLSGLSAGTQYHFRIRSSNQAGAESVSADSTFTTLGGGSSGAPCAPAPASLSVVNVRDRGARGDGQTDDTAAIQAAVNAVASGGTVLVPDGVYLVNAVSNGWQGIVLKSNMTLRLSSGAVLRALPTSRGNYVVVEVLRATNVSIVGGTIQGERGGHTGTSGESGYGIGIDSSTNIFVDGVTTRDNWGDGIYVSGAPSSVPSQNVTICNVVADNNRRQGLSITAANGVLVRDSIFRNTHGTLPEAGLDIEPDANGAGVHNVRVQNSQFLGNAGNQLDVFTMETTMTIAPFTTRTVPITNVILEGNTLDTLTTPNDGLRLRSANNVVVRNNRIVGRRYGINIYLSTGNIITGNTISGGVSDIVNGAGSTVSGNIFP